ncbi:hypothetical protein AB4Y36_03465 [Paraburkholderia sp. BR10936]|uniref:phage adaptor protein n=1 Tax=Paraburkholderia sp. BR10936 TaxID=3236993 RepID=UPI0034D17E8C
MSGFDSYDDFQEYVALALQRSNLGDLIPLFIQQAEIRLRDLFNDFPQQKAEPYILYPAAGTNVIALPSDFSTISKVLYGNHVLRFIPMSAVDHSNTLYHGHMFSEDGNNLYLQTQVGGQTQLTIYYFKELDQLSDSNQSNWLLEEYPNVYLYATLVEAAMHIMDDERIPLFEQKLQQALQIANQNKRERLVPKNTRLIRKVR